MMYVYDEGKPGFGSRKPQNPTYLLQQDYKMSSNVST